MQKRHTLAVKFQSGKVNRANGVIEGVAVITEGEAKGHGMLIDATTLEQVKTCAEGYAGGLKVKADHGSGIFSVAGYLRNFRIENDVLRADLHVLESEVNRDKLFEMAEQIPDCFGLSISFSGPDEIMNGNVFARCLEIYSADLVSEPAANPSGLFSAKPEDSTNNQNPMNPDDVQKAIEALRADMAAITEQFSQMKASLACGATKDEMQASNAKIAELEAKLNDRKDFAATIAKEFAAVSGVAPAVAPAAAPAVTLPASTAKTFEQIVNELVASGKTKMEAITFATKQHPDEYKAFYARCANGEAKML